MVAETITFTIILELPVTGITYGLQSGSGHSYEVLQKQVAQNPELVFEFALSVKKSKEGSLVLHGAVIQGPPDKRFIYINIGRDAGQKDAPISGRLKVPLPNFPDDIISATLTGGSFVTKILGTKAKDGSPTMGTIKPFDGWKLS